MRTMILIGGTGSLGHELAERWKNKYKIIIFSRDEQKQQKMKRTYPDFSYIIGDVRNWESVCRAIDKADIVVHAAAMKHIDVCEYNMWEAIKTNVLGARNVITACKDLGIKKMISVGTDKQVEALNLYGMCKAIQEKLTLDAGYNNVRYGNVMWSNGSVFHYFKELVEQGKPLTITNPNMTRFLLPLKHAHELIDRALVKMKGEVYIRKSPASTIKDLADIFSKKQKTIGERPGEKLHEVLITPDEMRRTKEEKDYFIITNKIRNKRYERYASNTTKMLKEGELKRWIYQ